MAVSAYKTYSAGEILTAADLNASFNQLHNNGTDVAFPLTKNGAAGGFILTGLGAGTAAGHSVRYEQIGISASVCEFRLTLTTAVPVTTADVTGATTIYCSPYKGNRIALYDGTTWNVRTSAEFSLALGTLTSGKPYDVFCYDNAGTPTLEFLVWTDDTTRATALVLQDGIYSKTGALTRRYLGTFYTTAATTTEDSFAKRFLWNYYNRVLRPMRVLEATNSWNYTTATIRQANGAAGNQLDLVMGVSEDVVSAEVLAFATNASSGVAVAVGIGVDSTTAFTSGFLSPSMAVGATGASYGAVASIKTHINAGRHYLAWLEYSVASGTTTWYGDNNTPLIQQSGIHGELLG